MNRKVFFIVLTALIITSIVGCAPKATESPTSAPSTEEPVASESPVTVDTGPTPTLNWHKPPYTFGLVIFACEAPYFSGLADWMKLAAQEEGMDIKVGCGDYTDPSSQVQLIENYITMKVDVIFINPVNAEAVQDALKKAHEAGIVIFFHNGTSPYADINLAAAPVDVGHQVTQLSYDWAVDHFGEEKAKQQKVALVVNLTGVNAERSNAMIEKANELYGAENVVATVEGSDTPTSMTAAENVAQAHPDVNIWIAFNDASALGVWEYYNSTGRDQTDVGIFGVDGDSAALEAIQAGTGYRATLSQALSINTKKWMKAAKLLLEGGSQADAQAIVGDYLFIPVNAANVQEIVESEK